jgi:predicted unusual protein kinase regulating ubiquinone biosynthesis (AarF/ABC1/UbiB family)
VTNDRERDRLSARMGRMATLGANLSRAGAEIAAARLVGGGEMDARIAGAIRAALGRSKGPLMKVAQMLATVPDLLPPEYAQELMALQSGAPAMGWPFVRRRMRAELGEDWESKFSSFEHDAFAAASLGQVHRAIATDGRALAVKLQYPDMSSAVESDLAQLNGLLALIGRANRALDPAEIGEEVGDRLREELDYEREAKHAALYARMLADQPDVAIPAPLTALSTKRVLTMTFLEGRPLTAFEDASQAERNRIAAILFKAWWRPFGQYALIHGDPHLGNYTFAGAGAERLNLLDFGCIRVFEPRFVEGVILLRNALRRDDRAGIEEAYAAWGFPALKRELVDTLNIWARFIYAPILEDRVRGVADGVKPAEYGRREFGQMRRGLLEHGPVAIPRAFVFMDRAAVGLGSAFLRLRAELNFSDLFDEAIAGFSVDAVSARQRAAMDAVGLRAAGLDAAAVEPGDANKAERAATNLRPPAASAAASDGE